MPKEYPRPFTPAWMRVRPHVNFIGPRVIGEHAIRVVDKTILKELEMSEPTALEAPYEAVATESKQEVITPVVILSEPISVPVITIIEEMPPTVVLPTIVNYQGLIIVGLSGGLLGT